MKQLFQTKKAFDRYILSPVKSVIKEIPPNLLTAGGFFFGTEAIYGSKTGLPEDTVSNAVIVSAALGIAGIEARKIINGDERDFDFIHYIGTEYPLITGAFSGFLLANGSTKTAGVFALGSVVLNKLSCINVDENIGLFNWAGASREVGSVLSSSLAVLTGLSMCVNRPFEAAVCGIGSAAVHRWLCVLPPSKEETSRAQATSQPRNSDYYSGEDPSLNGRRYVGSNVGPFANSNVLLLPEGKSEPKHPVSKICKAVTSFFYKKNQL